MRARRFNQQPSANSKNRLVFFSMICQIYVKTRHSQPSFARTIPLCHMPLRHPTQYSPSCRTSYPSFHILASRYRCIFSSHPGLYSQFHQPTFYQGNDKSPQEMTFHFPSHAGHDNLLTPTCKLLSPCLLTFQISLITFDLFKISPVTIISIIFFDSNGFQIKDQTINHLLLLEGNSNHGLYSISSIYVLQFTLASTNLWHKCWDICIQLFYPHLQTKLNSAFACF